MELGNWRSTELLPNGQARAVLGVANGMTSKEIAQMFGVSPGTINQQLNQVREKLNGNYDNTGKRSWVVTEAIRRGWLSPLTVFLFIGSMLFGLANDVEQEIRRSSTRLNTRTVASRMVRGRRTREIFDTDLLADDIQPKPNTLAPWSSVVMNKDVPLTNEMRLEMWRDLYEQIQFS